MKYEEKRIKIFKFDSFYETEICGMFYYCSGSFRYIQE